MSFIKDFAQNIIDKYDREQARGISISAKELGKTPSRTDVLNYLLRRYSHATAYLEIGVRKPEDNFNQINAGHKYSVDPGVEFEENPVDFKMTSDDFFKGLNNGDFLPGVLFDVIFVDGLHLARQVERDIENALRFVKQEGFIVLHDCNPPTEWHARETYNYKRTPAKGCWNGTTWKAFARARQRKDISSCCIDTDWGLGIISKARSLGHVNEIENPYWEYAVFDQYRREILNLMTFDEFKAMLVD